MKALYALITYVLVIAVIARQSSPLVGAVLSGGRLNVVFALLSSASRPAPGGGKAARPLGCVWLPPRSAKPPCPSRGLACRCVPPRQLGRAVGLKACLSCAVSAKPSALFAFSGCPPSCRLGRVHLCHLVRFQSCFLGGFPQTPLPHIMMMIFTFLLMEIIIII